jgi:hypothetical protein
MVLSNRSTRIYHARCAETSDFPGITTSKPRYIHGTTTIMGSVHKEIQGGISRTHKIRKVTMLIQISQINLP